MVNSQHRLSLRPGIDPAPANGAQLYRGSYIVVEKGGNSPLSTIPEMNDLTLSIVVPAYNEEAVIEQFHARLSEILDQLPMHSEVIYVNDGSSDATLAVLDQLRQQDNRIAILDLSRNFGKEIALTAGLDHAVGDAVVVIDADLQDPPELIPRMIEVWKDEGADVVYARRLGRDGETLIKRLTAAAFYKLMLHLGEVPIPPDTGDFRLLSRRALDGVGKIRERHRFMKGIFTWVGYSQRSIPYRRDARFAGKTKWNYWKLSNLAIEGITSATVAPLRLSSYLGIIIAVLAFVAGVWVVLKTLIYGDPVQGWPSLMVVVLFLGGIQLVCLGVLGEYLGRMFNETKNRPLYLINFLKPSDLSKLNYRHSRKREIS
jgi:glycosyltransferase involved in cell wall biosynthesis